MEVVNLEPLAQEEIYEFCFTGAALKLRGCNGRSDTADGDALATHVREVVSGMGFARSYGKKMSVGRQRETFRTTCC